VFSITTAPAGTIACRRLISGMGMGETTSLEPLAQPERDGPIFRRAARSSATATASRVTSSSVGPRQRRREISRSTRSMQRARLVCASSSREFADDGYDEDVDAEQIELLGDVQGIRVELRRCQQLAADGHNRGPSEQRHDNQPAGARGHQDCMIPLP
jgi:hypothetical protein